MVVLVLWKQCSPNLGDLKKVLGRLLNMYLEGTPSQTIPVSKSIKQKWIVLLAKHEMPQIFCSS